MHSHTLNSQFIEKGVISPDYKYLIGNKREHKFLWRRSAIANKRPDIYSESLTEKQMMELAGYPRIWDCGKVRYELV